ncbi:hypothetical protein LguiA_033980 [Lonicera macranthoides]
MVQELEVVLQKWRNLVSVLLSNAFRSLIDGFTENGSFKEAFRYFRTMDEFGDFSESSNLNFVDEGLYQVAYKNAHINDLAELVSQEMSFALDSSLLSDYQTEELSLESETKEELDESYVGLASVSFWNFIAVTTASINGEG